ncbi:site-specific integrase [Candidatus Bathyarchaeota archaeon]|nr:site-specific integrase [Candidatus Bathyarchaeota archaeon]
MRVSRWAYLMEPVVVVEGVEVDNPRFNADFKRWYDNLSMGSEVTAKERARVLYRFLVRQGLTVDGLVEMGKRDVREVEDMLMDLVKELHDEGKAPGYVENYLKSVKSWLEFNGVRLVRKIKIGNRGATPTLDDERVPTQDELLQVLGYAGVRGRCSISFMSLSGLRPEVLGKVDGSDGLEVRDLPEMVVEGEEVHFRKIPTMVVVRRELSKIRGKYFTFLGAEGCEYLKAYLEQRIAGGEELDGGSAIIAVKPGYDDTGFRGRRGRDSKHISTKTVTKEIRDAMRPRFKWRPYVLRAYFATALLLAESAGKMTHSYRQFHMGHSGDMMSRYTVNKGKLPEKFMEDMRRAFANSEEYLSKRKASGEDPEMTTIRTMVDSGVLDIHKPNVRAYLLKKLNIEDLEIKVARMRETGLEEDEAETTVIAGELGLDPMSLEALKTSRMKNTRKTIPEDQLDDYLDDGWDIYSTLPSGSIVVRKVTYI